MFECLARSKETEDGRKRGSACGAWRVAGGGRVVLDARPR